LGARDFDWLLMEWAAKKFQEKTGLNFITNAKSRLRFLDAIEKQRKVLSANSDAQINCEYLYEDEDLNIHLTRFHLIKLKFKIIF
jgi:heat shock 70kDa protein 4